MSSKEIYLQLSSLFAILAESIDEAIAKSAEPVKESIEMISIKECLELVKGLTRYQLMKLIKSGVILCEQNGKGGKYRINKASLLNYFNPTDLVSA